MSLFLLETDALVSSASSIQSLASQVRNLSSSVSGYDTSCEDGFNFDSAKSVIAGNLDACVTKIENTATVLENVQDSHTKLQNSMKFSASDEKDSSNNSNNSNSSGISKNTRNSGGTSSSRNSGGNYTGSSGGYSSVAGGVAATAIPVVTQTNLDQKKEEKEKIRIGLVNAKITSTGYAVVDKEVDKETKTLFADSKFSYKEGYATIGDCFVVACDSSIGQVGDVLQFSQKDGTVVHAVVGVSTHEKSNEDKLYFLVDKNSKDLKKSKICDTLIQNNKTIKNCGSIYDIRNVSSAAKSVSGDTNVVSDVINVKSTQDIQSTQDKKENQNNLENNQEGVEA